MGKKYINDQEYAESHHTLPFKNRIHEEDKRDVNTEEKDVYPKEKNIKQVTI